MLLSSDVATEDRRSPERPFSLEAKLTKPAAPTIEIAASGTVAGIGVKSQPALTASIDQGTLVVGELMIDVAGQWRSRGSGSGETGTVSEPDHQAARDRALAGRDRQLPAGGARRASSCTCGTEIGCRPPAGRIGGYPDPGGPAHWGTEFREVVGSIIVDDGIGVVTVNSRAQADASIELAAGSTCVKHRNGRCCAPNYPAIPATLIARSPGWRTAIPVWSAAPGRHHGLGATLASPASGRAPLQPPMPPAPAKSVPGPRLASIAGARTVPDHHVASARDTLSIRLDPADSDPASTQDQKLVLTGEEQYQGDPFVLDIRTSPLSQHDIEQAELPSMRRPRWRGPT
ncbi:MAG: hypothetical protein R3E68_09690 [Burkholderiaceae bacterium]